VPYIYTTVASVSACVVVAATTTVFSEEKTIEFIGAVASSLAWKCKWVCAGTCCTI
jgi:methyl coenzyme M reductase beta subunit